MPLNGLGKPNKIISIRADRYLIRTLNADDASDRWAVWFSDPQILYMLNAPAMKWDKGVAVKYINQFDQISHLILGFFEKQNETLVGVITVRINAVTGQGLINFLIGEADYRNKGVWSDIFVPFFDYMFDALGLKMMLMSALTRNDIVIKLMLKRGWKIDQAMKGHVKSSAGGANLDLCLLSLSRNSWRAWKKANLDRVHEATAGNPV